MFLRMPDGFPNTEYQRVHWTVLGQPNPRPVGEIYHFLDAWRAVAYRFRACVEQETVIQDVWASGKTLPLAPEEGREEAVYQQERALFEFFTAGQSALESFVYSMYIIGAICKPDLFPLVAVKSRKDITLKTTAAAFKKGFDGECMTAKLAALRECPEYKDWEAIRNVLAHRLSPSREVVFLGDQNAPSMFPEEQWQLDLPSGKPVSLEPAWVQAKRRWLTNTLADLIREGDTFIRSLPAFTVGSAAGR